MNTTLSASSPVLAPHPHGVVGDETANHRIERYMAWPAAPVHALTVYKVSAWRGDFGWRWTVYIPQFLPLPLGYKHSKERGCSYKHLPDCAPSVDGVGCASKEEALVAGREFLAALLADEVGGFVDGWV